MDIPEEVRVEILARLPLKSIARFRSVSKNWKSLFDSDDFRNDFMSRNSSSSLSWSIIQMKPHKLTLEIVGHHGCKTWGLPRSLGSLMSTFFVESTIKETWRLTRSLGSLMSSFFVESIIKKLLVLACTDGLILIYAEDSHGSPMYYVVNPLTQEWVQIPLPHFLSCKKLVSLQRNHRLSDTGLVTKMQSGIVVSYKVVWWITQHAPKVGFAIYSSDTGVWESRHVTCHRSELWLTQHKSIALNGILHWLYNVNRTFIAYDFYGGHDDACRIIDFPDSGQGYAPWRFRRSLSTSEGSIVYFNEFCENGNRTLRVWRLVNYIKGPEAWQLFREVNLVSLIELKYYFPVVMHPLNSEIIYLWNIDKRGLILFNLRTHVFSVHKETADESKCMDGCILSFNSCSEYMTQYDIPAIPGLGPNYQLFSQYSLPRWLNRLPRPQPT